MTSKVTKPDKIVILSEFVTQDDNSTGYFWSKIINSLGLKSEPVSVICPSPLAADCEKSTINGVNYFSFKSKHFNKKLLTARMWAHLKQTFGFINLLKLHVGRSDVLITGTNPVLLLLVLPFLRRLMGFRWILLVHDVYPDNMVPAKILNPQSLLYSILNKLFNFSYRSADLIFVIGRDMQSIISRKIGNSKNIRFIPNWVDENDVRPLPRRESEIIKTLQWDEKIVFQFFGNIGRVQGVENLLASIRAVTNPRAAFLFMGSGAKLGLIEEFISKNKDVNIAYAGEISQARKSEGLAACDIALVTLEKGMFGLGVPSKAYFSMAADRPIIAFMDKGSEISMMVQDHRIGWVCDSGNPAELAGLIDAICTNFESQPAFRARAVFEEFYSERVSLDRLVHEVIDFSNCKSIA